jgi:hypothetical protein
MLVRKSSVDAWPNTTRSPPMLLLVVPAHDDSIIVVVPKSGPSTGRMGNGDESTSSFIWSRVPVDNRRTVRRSHSNTWPIFVATAAGTTTDDDHTQTSYNNSGIPTWAVIEGRASVAAEDKRQAHFDHLKEAHPLFINESITSSWIRLLSLLSSKGNSTGKRPRRQGSPESTLRWTWQQSTYTSKYPPAVLALEYLTISLIRYASVYG